VKFGLELLMLTAAFAAEDFHDAGDTNEDIHNPFNLWPSAEEHFHDVQIHLKESAEADKTPVQGTDNYEDQRNFTCGTK
jgi:hypothetical protein